MKFKNILALAAVCIMGLSGCSSNSNNGQTTSNETTTAAATESSSSNETSGSTEASSQASNDTNSSGMKKIGVIQSVEHPALDSAYKGFIYALEENGYVADETIEIDYQNAQDDQSNLKTISQRFVNNKVDLICAISTQSAQSVAAETSEIPIVVTAVTDLVDAKLVESNEKPNTNVTGTTDMNPIKEQIDLLKQLVPDVKTIGILYTSKESNSELQANIAKEAAENIGLAVEVKTVASSNDVQQVTQSIINKVDAIYIPTDNVFASSMPIVAEIANSNKVPVICGEANMVKSGGLATLGIDYYKLGRQTGDMAARILNGESKPQDMPVESLKDMEYTINKEAVDALGITIPEDLQQYVE